MHKLEKRALLKPLTPEYVEAMQALEVALKNVRPLKAKHKQSLPTDIRELSYLLTLERAKLKNPYWTHPRNLSSYLYYFLPWNLVRLGRLLPGLDLNKLFFKEEALLDLGAGPATFGIALWLSLPELQDLKLTYVLQDRSRQACELGVQVWQRLAAELELSFRWQVKILPTPIASLAKIWPSLGLARPCLISAVNFLNEYYGQRPSLELHEVMELFLEEIGPLLQGSRLLSVEPGTRLGGKLSVGLRFVALKLGLYPIAPCPHADVCPLEERHKTWCHYTFDIKGAPKWLRELGDESGLSKDALSLSPLYLGFEHVAATSDIRVLSSPFSVPGIRGACRYGCSKKGLILLGGAESLAQGSLLSGISLQSAKVDLKSGAHILLLKDNDHN